MIIELVLMILVLLSGGTLSIAQVTVIAEGDPIRLDCSEQFQSDRRMRWFAGGHSSPPAYHILQYSERTPGNWVTLPSSGTKYTDRIDSATQGVCVISPSRKDDDTQYFCDVVAEPDPIKRPFTFKIIGQPTVTPGPTARSQEGTYIQLTCQLQEDNVGTITYIWSRSNGEVRGQVDPTRGTLTFTSTERGDEDRYTCRASISTGHTEASAQLFVDFLPTTFGIKTYTTGEILYSGDNKEMFCRTDGGRPLPTLSMNCVGQTGTKGGTGNIRTISFTAEVQPTWNNQNCVCTATQQIPIMTQNRSVTFIVYYPPTSASLTLLDSPWLENTVSRAQCHVTRGNPTSTFNWYKGEASVPIRTGAGEQVHELQYTFTKDDNGTSLACTVENQHTTDKGGNPARAEVTLIVEYYPRVTLTPGDDIIRRKENQPLTLTCTANSNPEAVNNNFQWTKDESPLSQAPEVQIPSVKKTDSGVYKCIVTVQRANNKVELSGHAQATVDINFFHLTSSRHQEVTENDNLVLNCTVDSNPPSFTFSKWTHIHIGKERELSSTRIEGNMAYLDLSPVNSTTGGMYRCEAGNDVYSKVTAQQNVTVFYTPKSDTHSTAGEIRYAALRSSVSFRTLVHAYPPDITFTWRALVNESVWQVLSDDDKYGITNTATSSSLVVRNVSVTDYTQYVLNATNNVRNGASFSFTLMPRDKPGEPIIVSEDSFSTAVSITLTWRSNFNGGYNQTFSVKMKESSQKDYTEMEKDIPDPGLGESVTRMFTKLKSLTLYQFKVIAHNEHMNGSSSESGTDIETKEAPVIRNTSLIVVREADLAFLEWEPPSGEYEWQIIEQREISRRERRSTCGPPGCTQHSYTKHTNNATVFAPEEKKYSFQLVLYDKGVEVGRSGNFEEEVIVVPYPSNEVNTGEIVGIVTGGLLVTLMISVLVLVYFRRRKQKLKETRICRMAEGESTTEIRSRDKAYEHLNRPAEYENVKMSTSDEDKTYQELQKPTHYENVERKNTLQEQTYEELTRPTNTAINAQTSGSIDEQGTTYEKLQYKN